MTSLRLAPLAPETLRADQRQLYDAILGGKRSTGHVGVALTLPNGALVGPFNPMLLSPQLGTAVQRVGEEVRFASLLSPEIKEILILLVAEKTASSFERYAHEAIARIQGMNELRIEQLRSGQKPTAMSAQEDAAWSIGHDLLAQNKVSDDS